SVISFHCSGSFFLLLCGLPLLQPLNNVIQPVADGWITHLEEIGHIFQTPACLHEFENEFLIVLWQARQDGKRVKAFNFGVAPFATKPFYGQFAAAAWAKGWQLFHNATLTIIIQKSIKFILCLIKTISNRSNIPNSAGH